jgi:hypothetical protein
MKVEAIKDHANEYGVREGKAKYNKAKGDAYEVEDNSEAQNLIDQGLVKKVKVDGSNDSKS